MEYKTRSRFGRGWVLAASTRIRKVTPRTTKAQLWKVESETVKGKYYSVVEKSDGFICDCLDFEHRQEMCKHCYAVMIYEAVLMIHPENVSGRPKKMKGTEKHRMKIIGATFSPILI
ncbi:MAG: SWIM zinc finger family protein, partial [Nitrososphaeraceae archaeon]